MASFDPSFRDADSDLMERAFGPAADAIIAKAGSNGAAPAAGAEGGMPPAPAAEAAPAAAEPGAPPAAAEGTPPAGGAAASPAAAAAPATPAPQSVNYEGISNGLIKSVEDITRISGEYQSQQSELAELRAKVAKDPFANDFVKTLNQMSADGKTAEQIDAFIGLQKLGEISKLTPMQAMIEARVLREGQDPDLVQKYLERKYGITPDMDDDVKKVIEIGMKEDAKADYEYLATQKKELATPAQAAPAPNTPVIAKEVITAQLVPIKEKIKDQFASLGEINLTGKKGDDGKPAADAIMFNLAIPKDFQDRVPKLMDEFFVDSGTEVNQENMQTFMDVVNVELFKQYGTALIQNCVNHALGEQEKKIRAEYENTNGLPPKTLPRTTGKKVADAITDEVLQAYARGE